MCVLWLGRWCYVSIKLQNAFVEWSMTPLRREFRRSLANWTAEISGYRWGWLEKNTWSRCQGLSEVWERLRTPAHSHEGTGTIKLAKQFDSDDWKKKNEFIHIYDRWHLYTRKILIHVYGLFRFKILNVEKILYIYSVSVFLYVYNFFCMFIMCL